MFVILVCYENYDAWSLINIGYPYSSIFAYVLSAPPTCQLCSTILNVQAPGKLIMCHRPNRRRRFTSLVTSLFEPSTLPRVTQGTVFLLSSNFIRPALSWVVQDTATYSHIFTVLGRLRH